MTVQAAAHGTEVSRPRALHIGLWIVQGILAAAFMTAGLMKVVVPVDQLAAKMPWVTGAMGPYVRLIGVAEIAGALGLILPAATRILPKLTVAAALGLVLNMMGALATHISRAEYAMVVPPLILGALSAFVAWGRAKAAPISAR